MIINIDLVCVLHQITKIILLIVKYKYIYAYNIRLLI